MENMIVTAPKGKTCPKERSRSLIGDTGETTVPNNNYYRCRIASGELLFKGHIGQKVTTEPIVEPNIESKESTIDRKKRGGTK